MHHIWEEQDINTTQTQQTTFIGGWMRSKRLINKEGVDVNINIFTYILHLQVIVPCRSRYIDGGFRAFVLNFDCGMNTSYLRQARRFDGFPIHADAHDHKKKQRSIRETCWRPWEMLLTPSVQIIFKITNPIKNGYPNSLCVSSCWKKCSKHIAHQNPTKLWISKKNDYDELGTLSSLLIVILAPIKKWLLLVSLYSKYIWTIRRIPLFKLTIHDYSTCTDILHTPSIQYLSPHIRKFNTKKCVPL